MAEDPVTKRLIISGLTPQITADDLSRRLATFGSVKAADGFGLPDGLGEPKKFGYVTLETTAGKLAKCMNLLSGSTWKGARLRFGEAKPDFRERIALENKQAAEEPPKKMRKRVTGVESEDMTLVTPQNATERKGWKVSALGRVTHPVKIRPAHPLTSTPEDKPKPKTTAVKFTDAKKSADNDEKKKKKKRAKDPDIRARRRTIDMTKFGSTHLKGMFLDLEVPLSSKKKKDVSYERELRVEGSSDDDSDAEMVEVGPSAIIVLETTNSQDKSTDAVAGPSKSPRLPSPSVPAPVIPPSLQNKSPKASSEPTQALSLPTAITSQPPELSTDIQKEKAQTLSLLVSLFGGADDGDDWVGRESVGSDIDVDELVKGDRMLVDEDDAGFEVVPLGASSVKTVTQEDDEENDSESDVEAAVAATPEQEEAKEKIVKPKTLKDLFAPQEEEVGFSLLGQLDLDIELDDELPYTIGDQSSQQPQNLYDESTQPSAISTHAAITLQTHASQTPLVLDPRQPLFFPLPQEGSTNRARQRDVFDLAKDNGWNWRDPAVGFYRTGTDEDIKKRWEESKGELTRDWKRRCREAAKVNRRKRGGVEGENEY